MHAEYQMSGKLLKWDIERMAITDMDNFRGRMYKRCNGFPTANRCDLDVSFLDGTLTIAKGTTNGVMHFVPYQPGLNSSNVWTHLRKQIIKIVIKPGVENISTRAFSNCTNLESVVIPDTVKRIGDQAFSNCTNLESVVIPDTVKRIGDQAFYNCTRLNCISLPMQCVVSESAFSGCNIGFFSCASEQMYGWWTGNSQVIHIGGKGVLAGEVHEQFFNTRGDPCSPTDPHAEFSRILVKNMFGREEDHPMVSWTNIRHCQKIFIHNGITEITQNAFYAISADDIYIPSTVEYIDDSTFPEKAKIYGNAGSYAEEYARKNGRAFFTLKTAELEVLCDTRRPVKLCI